jgi:hypothetical protein
MAKQLSRIEREGMAREKLIRAGACRSIAADLPEQAQKAMLEKYAGKLERSAATLHPGVSLLVGAA